MNILSPHDQPNTKPYHRGNVTSMYTDNGARTVVRQSSNGLSFGECRPTQNPELLSSPTTNSGSRGKNIGKPQIPSLKTKIHQASLGVTASESAGASTAIENLRNSNTKINVAPMTAGTKSILTGGGELRNMTGNGRGSLTHLSQLTPS